MTDMLLSEISISQIQMMGKVPQPTGKVCVIKNRAWCGLLFVERGSIRYIHDGRAYVSDVNHILFMPKGITYTLNCVEDSLSYVVNFYIHDSGAYPSIQSFGSFDTRRLLGQLAKMEQIWTFREPAYSLKCMGLLYDMMGKIEEGARSEYAPASLRQKILPSIQYMEGHFNDPALTNEKLAEQSGVSTVYFRKLFMNVYGLPPMRYVQNLRIEKAKALLQTGYLTVTEIASMVGFGSIFHFSRMFRQIVGVSPSMFAMGTEEMGTRED